MNRTNGNIIGKLFFIFFLKNSAAHNTHGRNAKEKNNYRQRIAAVHLTCFEQYITDYEIKKSPGYIYCRR